MDDLRNRGFHHTNDFNRTLTVPAIKATTNNGRNVKKSEQIKSINENNNDNLFKSKSFVWTNVQDNKHSSVEDKKKPITSHSTASNNINLESLIAKQKHAKSNVQKDRIEPSNLNAKVKTPELVQSPFTPPQQPIPNRINILSPIVMPNVTIEVDNVKKPEPPKRNDGLFVKELNADNYAVLSAQWHQNKKNLKNSDKISNFQQQLHEKYSNSKETSIDNCKYGYYSFFKSFTPSGTTISCSPSYAVCPHYVLLKRTSGQSKIADQDA